jgi:hypothetical protein
MVERTHPGGLSCLPPALASWIVVRRSLMAMLCRRLS